jgi:hypothetical protein
VYELALALYFFVVRFCKSSVSPITNPNPVYSHTHTRDNIYDVSNGNLFSAKLKETNLVRHSYLPNHSLAVLHVAAEAAAAATAAAAAAAAAAFSYEQSWTSEKALSFYGKGIR